MKSTYKISLTFSIFAISTHKFLSGKNNVILKILNATLHCLQLLTSRGIISGSKTDQIIFFDKLKYQQYYVNG